MATRWWWAFLPLAGCVDYGLTKHEGKLTVSPGEIRFGDVEEGEVAVETFRVFNEGNGPLDISGVTIEGASTFVLPDTDISGELPQGWFWDVDVVYTPDSDAGDVGYAYVSAADGQEAEVLLSGRRVEPGSLDTGSDDAPVTEVPLADGEMKSIEVEFTVSGGLDLAFLLDTTRSMDSLIDSVKSDFDAIAEDIDASFVDAGWGLATYEDYPVYPYGSGGADMPFFLRVPMTDDRGAIVAGLEASVIHEGQDAPESTMEALVQGLTGRGYDLDCDGAYDAGQDVPPFTASAEDAFGGTTAGVGSAGDGGFGFREGRLPVIIYATNYELRDNDDARYGTPGGCLEDAGFTDVVEAASERGAKLVGVAVEMSESSYAFGQMQRLGEATASMADLDGDGNLEPAAVTWSGESATFRTTVVDAIKQLVGALEWQMVWLEWEDPHGIVVDYLPAVRTDVQAGETVTFQVNLQGVPLDEPVDITFNLMGDGGILLAQQTLTILYEE